LRCFVSVVSHQSFDVIKMYIIARYTVFVSVFLLVPTSKAWLMSPRTGTKSTILEALSLKNTMGIPPHLDDMHVAVAFQSIENSAIMVEKLSSNPPIFVLRNFMSSDECQEIMDSALALEPAQVVSTASSGNERKNSMVGWLENTPGSLPRELARRAHAILLTDQVFHGSRGVEPLQVVHYEKGGEYVLHQDGNHRLLTVLYYINGAGETWFPLADSVEEPRSRAEALFQCRSLEPGHDGVLVSCEGRGKTIKKGDAIAFFNYRTNGTCDWRAIHAGIPASSIKWIANHWFYHVPPGTDPEP
jgi:2OG-Fe(II) oxygenase superfamily